MYTNKLADEKNNFFTLFTTFKMYSDQRKGNKYNVKYYYRLYIYMLYALKHSNNRVNKNYL